MCRPLGRSSLKITYSHASLYPKQIGFIQSRAIHSRNGQSVYYLCTHTCMINTLCIEAYSSRERLIGTRKQVSGTMAPMGFGLLKFPANWISRDDWGECPAAEHRYIARRGERERGIWDRIKAYWNFLRCLCGRGVDGIFLLFFVEGGESNEVDGKWAFVRSLLRVGRGEGYYTNKSRCCFSLRPYRHFV